MNITQLMVPDFRPTGRPHLIPHALPGLNRMAIPGIRHSVTPTVAIVPLEGDSEHSFISLPTIAAPPGITPRIQVVTVQMTGDSSGTAAGWISWGEGIGFIKIPLHWTIQKGNATFTNPNFKHFEGKSYEELEPWLICPGISAGMSTFATINGKPCRFWDLRSYETLPYDPTVDQIGAPSYRYTINGANRDGRVIVGSEIRHGLNTVSRALAWRFDSTERVWHIISLGFTTQGHNEAFACTANGSRIVLSRDGAPALIDIHERALIELRSWESGYPIAGWPCDIDSDSELILINQNGEYGVKSRPGWVSLAHPSTGRVAELSQLYGDEVNDNFTALGLVRLGDRFTIVGATSDGAMVIVSLEDPWIPTAEKNEKVRLSDLTAAPAAP